MRKPTSLGLALFIVLLSSFVGSGIASAQQAGITVQSSSAQIQFPDGIQFTITASAPTPIKSITLIYSFAGSNVSQYGVFKFDPASPVTTQYMLRTKVGGESGGSFQPPGTAFTYSYRIQDSAGNTLDTPSQDILYMDSRFTWDSVNKGLVTVYYYGPVQTRAQSILDVVTQTLGKMGAVLNAKLTRPVHVIVYNNYRDMSAAIPFVSQATSSGLITEGLAFGDRGVLLLYGDDPNIMGVTSHETTHLLVDQAAGGSTSFIPSWLNEGLAEYGNIQPGTSYSTALDQGIRSNHLLPLTSMATQPGSPDDVILFYGEARSIVRYMIDNYGAPKMQQFLSLLKQGQTVDDALRQTYGFDRVGLDNFWRKTVGAPQLSPQQSAPTPTAAAVPTFPPFGAPTPPGSASSTPVVQTPPTPTATATPASSGGGFSCNKPAASAGPLSGPLDVSFVSLLAIPVALGILARRCKK